MSLDQKRAHVFGVLFLITFITSIPAVLLYQPVLDDPVGYIAGAGHNNQILFGALLELLLIVANNRSFYNDEVHQERVARMRSRPVENKWIGQRISDPDVDLAAIGRA